MLDECQEAVKGQVGEGCVLANPSVFRIVGLVELVLLPISWSVVQFFRRGVFGFGEYNVGCFGFEIQE